MAYIEGIGDEVLLVFGAFFVILIVVIAWLSTSVQEPRINLIVVDRHRFNQVIQRVREAGYRIARFHGGRVVNVGQVEGTVTIEGNSGRTEVANTAGIQELSPSENTHEEESSAPSTKDSPSDSVNGFQNNERDSQEVQQESKDSENRTETDTSEVVSSLLAGGKNELNSQNCVEELTSSESQNERTDSGGVSEEDTKSGEKESSQSKEDAEDKRPQKDNPSVTDNRGASTSQTGEQLQEGHIRVSIRFLDDRQRIVQARPQETIGQFKRNHFARELAQNSVVRLIFNGRELRPDTLSLQAYNIQDRAVIHCIVRETPSDSTDTPVEVEEEELNLGAYIFPLFGVILALIWYSRFAYGKYFNAISTVALVGITFLYIVVLLASFRNNEDNNNLVEVHEHQD